MGTVVATVEWPFLHLSSWMSLNAYMFFIEKLTFIRPNSSTYTSGCHPPEPHGAVFKKSWKPSVYFWDCQWKHSGDPVELFGCCGVPTHLPINSIYPSTNSSKHLGFCHPQNSKWPIERHHVDPHGTRLRTLGTSLVCFLMLDRFLWDDHVLPISPFIRCC